MPLWILVAAISTQKYMDQGHSSSTFYCSNQGVPKLVQHPNFHLKLISELNFLVNFLYLLVFFAWNAFITG